MKKRHLVAGSLAVFVLLAGISVYSQVTRPYRNGSVWSIAFIRVKPGMDTAYSNYLAGQWKANQEAMKKEGLIFTRWSSFPTGSKSSKEN